MVKLKKIALTILEATALTSIAVGIAMIAYTVIIIT